MCIIPCLKERLARKKLLSVAMCFVSHGILCFNMLRLWLEYDQGSGEAWPTFGCSRGLHRRDAHGSEDSMALKQGMMISSCLGIKEGYSAIFCLPCRRAKYVSIPESRDVVPYLNSHQR